MNQDPQTTQTLAFVDVETTGLTASKNKIIEIAILQVQDGKLVDEFCSFIDPGRPIPAEITKHTGINGAHLEGAPSFAELWPHIDNRLRDATIVAHFAEFDSSFLAAEYKRLNAVFDRPLLCTCQLSRRLFPGYRHHSLGAIIDRFRLDCPQQHRALDDARAMWQFFQIVKQNWPMEKIQELGSVSPVKKAIRPNHYSNYE